MDPLPFVIVILRNDEHQMASKQLIISSSTVWKAMLDYSRVGCPRLYLNMPKEKFLQIYHFLLGMPINFSSPHNAAYIYYITRMYGLEELKKISLEFVLENLNEENVCTIHDFTCKKGLRLLQYYCWKTFDSRWNSIFEERDFLHCGRSTVLTFVSRPKYESLPEVKLFLATYKWILRKFTNRAKVDPSVLKEKEDKLAEFRSMARPFLSKIRFLAMSLEDLNNHVFPTFYLTDNEKEAIRLSFLSEHKINLPDTIRDSSRISRIEQNSEILFKYNNDHNSPYDSEIPMDVNKTFACELLVYHECFLYSIKLPITHLNETEGVKVIFEGSTGQLQKPLKTQNCICDTSGNISIEPAFLKQDSITHLSIKLSEDQLTSENNIKIDYPVKCFIPDDDLKKQSNEATDKNNEKWGRIYFAVNLYF